MTRSLALSSRVGSGNTWIASARCRGGRAGLGKFRMIAVSAPFTLFCLSWPGASGGGGDRGSMGDAGGAASAEGGSGGGTSSVSDPSASGADDRVGPAGFSSDRGCFLGRPRGRLTSGSAGSSSVRGPAGGRSRRPSTKIAVSTSLAAAPPSGVRDRRWTGFTHFPLVA